MPSTVHTVLHKAPQGSRERCCWCDRPVLQYEELVETATGKTIVPVLCTGCAGAAMIAHDRQLASEASQP